MMALESDPRDVMEKRMKWWLRALLIGGAFVARLWANSYRKFRVGACALGYNPNAKRWRRYRLFFSANTQLRPGPHPQRCCAERKIRHKARDNGYWILYIAVVGPHQPDDFSGLDHGATLPCGYCREDFAGDIRQDGPIQKSTIIAGFNPRTFKCVLISVERFLKGHRRAKRSKGGRP